jgi:hypothetical protein
MRTTSINQPKSINILDLVLIIWGCVMLPLWVLGFYQSVKEDTLEMQGLVMSAAALVVSLCFITTPLFRRQAAITALIFSGAFTIAAFVYNTSSINLLISGLVISTLFLLTPSIFLLLSSIPSYHTQPFVAATFPVGIRNRSSRELLFIALCIVLLLVVIAGMYGLGFAR